MKLFKIIVLSLIVLTVYFGCYYDKEDLLYPQFNTNCDTINVTYKSSVTSILSSYCYNCHGNSVASSYGGNIKLQDYADVKSNIDKIYGAINHQNGYKAMPNGGGKINVCALKTIQIWKDAGTPNN